MSCKSTHYRLDHDDILVLSWSSIRYVKDIWHHLKSANYLQLSLPLLKIPKPFKQTSVEQCLDWYKFSIFYFITKSKVSKSILFQTYTLTQFSNFTASYTSNAATTAQLVGQWNGASVLSLRVHVIDKLWLECICKIKHEIKFETL